MPYDAIGDWKCGCPAPTSQTGTPVGEGPLLAARGGTEKIRKRPTSSPMEGCHEEKPS